MGLTSADLEKFRDLEATPLARKGRLGVPNSLPKLFIFEVAMPGEIEKHRLSEPNPAPSWLLDPQGAGRAGWKNSARLEIPLQDILQGKVKQAVWEIACGPTIANVVKEWEEFKKQRTGK